MINHLEGIVVQEINTNRIKLSVLIKGPEDGIPVIFVHGNCSSAIFWEELMVALPSKYRAIALDLRGFGATEEKAIDATKGLSDFAEDVRALTEHFNLVKYHVVGHSMGGAVIFRLLASEEASKIASATLVCPGSPFGFGGSKGLDGTPCWIDGAGSGGGVANREFARFISEKERGVGSPNTPRNVLLKFYFKAPFQPKYEEELLTSVLSTRIGDSYYPGDSTSSTNWPGMAPGKYGSLNALSSIYVGDTVTKFIASGATFKTPICWIRGSDDQVVSDTSLFDMGFLGKIGVIPGWPGEDVFPPQPMIAQTRHVLDEYKQKGGSYSEHVIPDSGHTPFIEKPDEFKKIFFEFLDKKKNN